MKRPTEGQLRAMREDMGKQLRRIAPQIVKVMTALDHKWANLKNGPRVPNVDEVIALGDRLIGQLDEFTTSITAGLHVSYAFHDYEGDTPVEPGGEIGSSLNWNMFFSPQGCWTQGNHEFLSDEADRHYFGNLPRREEDQYHLLFPYEKREFGFAYPCNVAGKIDPKFVGPLLLALLGGEGKGYKVGKPRVVPAYPYDEEDMGEWDDIWDDVRRNDADEQGQSVTFETYKQEDINHQPDGDPYNAPMAEYGRVSAGYAQIRLLEIAKAHKLLSQTNPDFGVVGFTMTPEIERELAQIEEAPTPPPAGEAKFKDDDIPF